MITDDDIGKEVKVRLLNAEIVRGKVMSCGSESATIDTGAGRVSVKYNKVSTVSRVGDFSSDRDRR